MKHRPERDQAIFAVLRAIRGQSAASIANKTFVSASTIAKWRKPVSQGGTKFPQLVTLAAVAATAGLEFKLVEKERGRHAGRRRVHGIEMVAGRSAHT